MSEPRDRELGRLAERITEVLTAGAEAAVDGDPRLVFTVVEQAIARNLATEAGIHREAERTLAAMAARTRDMDRSKLLAGLRERIAKKKGFTL